MNRHPESTTAESIPFRSAAMPAYYLGRSAAIWLAATHQRSIGTHRAHEDTTASR